MNFRICAMKLYADKELSKNNLTFTLVFLHNCYVTKNLTHLRVRAVFASLLLRKNPAPKSSTYFRTIPKR